MAKRIVEVETRYTEAEQYTDDEVVDLCCQPQDLPVCAKVGEKVSVWQSGTDQENWPASTKALIEAAEKFPYQLRVKMKERTSPCGFKEERYVRSGSCCDEAPLLEWDYNYNVDVMDPSAYITLKVIGGVTPFTVSIQGSGFWLDQQHTRTKMIFTGRSIRIFSDEFACGVCKITVDDGCSSVTESVRSTVGRWEPILNPDYLNHHPNNPELWPYSGVIGYGERLPGTSTAQLIAGSIKYEQYVGHGHSSGLHQDSCCAGDVQGCCADPNEYLGPEQLDVCTVDFGGIFQGWSLAGAIGWDIGGTAWEPLTFFGETDCGYTDFVALTEDPCSNGMYCEAGIGWKTFDNRGFRKWEWRC